MILANECLLYIYSVTPTIYGEIFLSTKRLLESQEYFSLSEKDGQFFISLLARTDDDWRLLNIVDVKLDKEWFMSKLDKPLKSECDVHSPEYMPLFIGEYIQHKIKQLWSII